MPNTDQANIVGDLAIIAAAVVVSTIIIIVFAVYYTVRYLRGVVSGVGRAAEATVWHGARQQGYLGPQGGAPPAVPAV